MRGRVVVVLMLWLAALPALAQSRLAEGQTVSGTVQLGIRAIPLPPGDWKVFAVASGSGTTREGAVRYDQNRAMLLQEDGSRLLGLVWINVGQASGQVTWPEEPRPCRAPYTDRVVASAEPWKRDCGKLTWYFRPGAPGPATDVVWRPLLERGQADRRLFPQVMHSLRFFMADGQGYLEVQYDINPDAHGVPVDGRDHAVSAWNLRNGSALHIGHWNRLKRYLRALHPLVSKGFADRRTTPAPAF